MNNLINALEFYANPENWKDVETGIGMIPGDAVDYGKTAQLALDQMKKQQKKVFRLVIELENDAFQQNSNQLAELLRDAARKVEKSQLQGKLVDLNGNKVGHFSDQGELI